jgi:hypothetical protein
MTGLEPGARPEVPAQDIRDQLRKDHETALAELQALHGETDERRCKAKLMRLRQAWMVHALAEETVVYRPLEIAEAASPTGHRADERFIEHELVGGLFEKLARIRPGTLEWHARLNVVRDLIARHIEAEHAEMFARLERQFPEAELRDMGQRFVSAAAKLRMLEEAKAA